MAFSTSYPSNQPINQSDKPKVQRWPFRYGIYVHHIWAVSNIWEGIRPSGTRRWSKITTCTFYCNWWPISVISKHWGTHWLAPSGTKTHINACRCVLRSKQEHKEKNVESKTPRYLVPMVFHHNDKFVRMLTEDLWSLTCLDMDFWCSSDGLSDTDIHSGINHIRVWSSVYPWPDNVRYSVICKDLQVQRVEQRRCTRVEKKGLMGKYIHKIISQAGFYFHSSETLVRSVIITYPPNISEHGNISKIRSKRGNKYSSQIITRVVNKLTV